jgi:hypothetical protein
LIKDAGNVIIFLPTLDWHDHVQRPHHLARAFAKAGWTVFFITDNLSKDRVKGIDKISENLFLCSNIRLLKNLQNPWIQIGWTANVFFLGFFKSYRLIYEYIDKLDVFQFYGQRMIDKHHQLLAQADMVIASASILYTEVVAHRPDAVLIPNGVFPGDFQVPEDAPCPEEMASLVASKKPIIGYYGVFARWIDYELMIYCAGKMPDFHFVYLGFDLDDTRSAYDWSPYPNLRFIGKKPYHELPFYSRHFDAAFIPFLVNELTNAVSPVKLFEFMATRLPVVSTSIAECTKYDAVLVFHTFDEAIATLKKAVGLKKDKMYQARLAKDLSHCTWDHRCQMMLDKISVLKS